MAKEKHKKALIKVPEHVTAKGFLTADEYRMYAEETPPEEKQLKYRNVITVNIQGIKFRSKKERDYFETLQMLKERGKIKDFKFQVPYIVVDGFKGYIKVDGKAKEVDFKPIKYVADFVIYYPLSENTKERVVDVKSPATKKLPLYKLKKRLMLQRYGILIEEI